MTDKQLKALRFIIKHAKGDNWHVPHAKDLAHFLHGGQKVTMAQERAAASLIKRLARSFKAFRKQRNRWLVNTGKLITEPSTARYILLLHSKCHEPNNIEKSVSKEEFHRGMTAYDPQSLDRIFATAVRAKYIEEATLVSGKILRVGHATRDQLPWLQDLATNPIPPP